MQIHVCGVSSSVIWSNRYDEVVWNSATRLSQDRIDAKKTSEGGGGHDIHSIDGF